MRSTLMLVVVVVALAGCHRGDSDIASFTREARASHKGMESAIPVLRVTSLQDAFAYYRDKLGFEILWKYGDPADFGAVKRDEAVYFLCQGCQSAGPTWTFVAVPNVDTLYRELQSKGAIVKMPPKDEPWSLREMHVADPDGNLIRFAGNTEHDD